MPSVLSLIDLKKFLFFSVFIYVLLSCSDVEKHPEPENLLPKEKMVKIYTDMVLLDAVKRSTSKNFESYNLDGSDHIYNKYKIDSTTLADNVLYYNLNFEVNSEIYKKVKENIEDRKTLIDSIVHLRDSLKKLEQQKKLKIKDSINLEKEKVLKTKDSKKSDQDPKTTQKK